jgi:deoxyribodipyrimidine photo-lyase
MQFKISLFIFRRDLRLEDNRGLIEALKQSDRVIPCFILDPRQLVDNNYKSDRAIQFMLESLQDLNAQLKQHKGKLYLFEGKAEEVVAQLIASHKIEAIFFNRDYTPFSRARDTAIEKLCKKKSVAYCTYDDALLNAPNTVMKPDHTPYVMFTPYFKRARQLPVEKPVHNTHNNYLVVKINDQKPLAVLKKYSSISNPTAGGRNAGLKLVNKLKNLEHYARDHDYPALQATSHLSAHLKFGTISVREVFHAAHKALGNASPLLRQLYWRDFFTMIAYNFPQVFGHPFHKKYSQLAWKNNTALFKRWCTETTGFPIVDAGMRELNATGYMHNRVRLIVGSFLVKDLHIDWQWGEKYFAQTLADYDPAVNNGNWQWVASTGCDAQPYFRIFNPWLQQKKFDAAALYIKNWVPELNKVPTKDIHNWHKEAVRKKYRDTDYPAPIVDHAIEAAYAKKAYRSASTNF